MKKSNFFLLLAFIFFTIGHSYATIRTITAGGTSFTPPVLSAIVGDTVKWQWLNGSHTTTSITVPAGALTWNVPLDTLHPVFIYVITQPGTFSYICIPHQAFGMTGTINATPNGIKPIGISVPANYNLQQNFPNPFNPTTNIRFDLPRETRVNLVVYDVQGRQVAELINGQLNAGSYNFDWDASAFPSGVYFYSLTADNFRAVKKMALVK